MHLCTFRRYLIHHPQLLCKCNLEWLWRKPGPFKYHFLHDLYTLYNGLLYSHFRVYSGSFTHLGEKAFRSSVGLVNLIILKGKEKWYEKFQLDIRNIQNYEMAKSTSILPAVPPRIFSVDFFDENIGRARINYISKFNFPNEDAITLV